MILFVKWTNRNIAKNYYPPNVPKNHDFVHTDRATDRKISQLSIRLLDLAKSNCRIGGAIQPF